MSINNQIKKEMRVRWIVAAVVGVPLSTALSFTLLHYLSPLLNYKTSMYVLFYIQEIMASMSIISLVAFFFELYQNWNWRRKLNRDFSNLSRRKKNV